MALAGTASVERLQALGVTSVRVTYHPLLPTGEPDPAGIAEFRRTWGPLVAAGFRLHGVTPFPADLPGSDPDDPQWWAAWRRVGAGLAEALGDLVDSWQIGNELNIWQFRRPLRSIADAARFVRAMAEGLREGLPGLRLGINAFGVGASAHELYRAVYDGDAGTLLDYVGVDYYPGIWEAGRPADWAVAVERAWTAGRGRPVVVCEVGCPSRGDVAEPGELERYLRTLGYRNPAAVEGDRDRLLAAAPPLLAAALAELPSDAWDEDFLDTACHLIKKWRWTWDGRPHSPAKQARFFAEVLATLLGDDRIDEVLLFMLQDVPVCWTCGAEDCPLETAWGLLDRDGRPKPAFEVVAAALRGTADAGP